MKLTARYFLLQAELEHQHVAGDYQFVQPDDALLKALERAEADAKAKALEAARTEAALRSTPK